MYRLNANATRPEFRYLYLDLNAYFASVEQQERPDLRGRPVAVVPMIADTTFVIAASYEAKRFGVSTGTRVGDAKRMCPGLVLTPARGRVYVQYHDRILEAVERVLPIERVCSIDEMYFKLLGEERRPARAMELALEMKRTLRDEVGQYITASIGIGPNPFLAKVGTEMRKPDGLVMLPIDELPHALDSLKLTDFPGINRRMKARLNAVGLFSARDLCRAGPELLRRGFGSVVGEVWYWLLRGYDLPRKETSRKTLSHSHVMSPRFRTHEGCKQVVLRLLHKAAARLRSEGLTASILEVAVSGRQSWGDRRVLDPTQDTVTLMDAFASMWKQADFETPVKASVVLSGLRPASSITPSLFDDSVARTRLSHTVDELNRRFGKHTVLLAETLSARNTAPERIAFGKTRLFDEGGDRAWVDTFRGRRPSPPSATMG